MTDKQKLVYDGIKQDKSMAEIARELKISRQAVRQVVHALIVAGKVEKQGMYRVV